MNYTELKTYVQEALENTFTDTQLDTFTQMAEQKIHNSVQLPELRKSCDGTMTTNNEFLSVPTDFLFMYNLQYDDGSGNVELMVQVDDNFIREAYPNRTSTGAPKYYAIFDVDSLILGPTPDANYAARLTYARYPESIVTAENTWLGDHYDTALINGTIVEAYRFMKGEPDLMQQYEKLFMESLTLLKQLSDGKMRQDTYKNAQARVPVI